MKRGGALVAGFLLAASPAFADATGEWTRADGKARVRIAPCGAALCGTISWVQDPKGPGKVGERVFFDMKPSGENAWAGSAFNPEDGKTYAGKMALKGDALNTAGCVLGGLICKSVDWTRTR